MRDDYDIPNGQATGETYNQQRYMDVPFNVTRYEEEKFAEEFDRFKELLAKYWGDKEEILEFARLWNKFTPNSNKSKYINK